MLVITARIVAIVAVTSVKTNKYTKIRIIILFSAPKSPRNTLIPKYGTAKTKKLIITFTPNGMFSKYFITEAITDTARIDKIVISDQMFLKTAVETLKVKNK